MKPEIGSPQYHEKALQSVQQLIDQFEALAYCHDLIEQAATAKVMLDAQQRQVEESARKLSTIDEALAAKEAAFEQRMEIKRASLTEQLKDLQATLDRKQHDFEGWTHNAQREMASHEQLIREMQDRLAQVQADYRAVVSLLDTARTTHANFVKSLAGAV